MPVWPGTQDLIIQRYSMHQTHGNLGTRISHSMHVGTHVDAPVHVNENGCYIDEVPLETYYGSGVVVSIPKNDWETITAEELDNAEPQIEEGDIVIITPVGTSIGATTRNAISILQVSTKRRPTGS